MVICHNSCLLNKILLCGQNLSVWLIKDRLRKTSLVYLNNKLSANKKNLSKEKLAKIGLSYNLNIIKRILKSIKPSCHLDIAKYFDKATNFKRVKLKMKDRG